MSVRRAEMASEQWGSYRKSQVSHLWLPRHGALYSRCGRIADIREAKMERLAEGSKACGVWRVLGLCIGEA